MKQTILLIVLIGLSGCAIPLSRNTHLYMICYKEDMLLSVTGQWTSNELYYKCDKRRELGFDHRFGSRNNDIITDFKSKD